MPPLVRSKLVGCDLNTIQPFRTEFKTPGSLSFRGRSQTVRVAGRMVWLRLQRVFFHLPRTQVPGSENSVRSVANNLHPFENQYKKIEDGGLKIENRLSRQERDFRSSILDPRSSILDPPGHLLSCLRPHSVI